MSNLSGSQLSKIIHIASPPEAIISGPEVPDTLVPLTPQLTFALTSTMLTLIERGEWKMRVYGDGPDNYVYERVERP